jgi:hypothetical protein
VAQDLMAPLTAIVGETIAKQREWPKTPRALSGRIQRAAATLRKVKISVRRGDPHSRERRLFVLEKGETQQSRQSRQSRTMDFSQKSVAVSDGSVPIGPNTVTDNSLKFNGRDDGDDGDGHFPPFSSAACQACDGVGCPTCRPRDYGIGDSDPFEILRNPSLRLKGDAA